jgi:hypothetical protein
MITIKGDNLEVSDGYHTIGELYEHRINLFIALCKYVPSRWRSIKHSDGSSFDGWFIMGISTKDGKQITYHLPMSKWEDTSFATELDKAPEWDGHTSNDVLKRLLEL